MHTSEVKNPVVDLSMTCPSPVATDVIRLSDGGGGRHMQQLLQRVILPALGIDGADGTLHDSAILHVESGALAFTTDSYVVHPLQFPGGDIGTMAVYGTVNDLAMSGAVPIALSCSFIIEEGFSRSQLKAIAQQMGVAARRCGVKVVTGDTKVVERGHGHGLYVNTAGIGRRKDGVEIHSGRIQSGDAIIVSGDIGRHGVAVMAARDGLAFETSIESDLAPLHEMVSALLTGGIPVHCLRDLTRGGLGAALVELATASKKNFLINEDAIPVSLQVEGACELLGLDPLFVANEGRLVAFVPEDYVERTLRVMATHSNCAVAAIVGRVLPDDSDHGTHSEQYGVVIQTTMGSMRHLDLPAGEQLPRIC